MIYDYSLSSCALLYTQHIHVSMLYTFIAIRNCKIEFYVSVCWKATEQVIQVMQSYIRCLNLYQVTAAQQNTDHVGNMQVSA